MLLKDMKDQDKCKHRNVVCEMITSYVIPEGWDKLQEKEGIDMADYEGEDYTENVWRCLECGKELDRSSA